MTPKQRKVAVRLLGEALLNVSRAKTACTDNPVITRDLTDLQNGLRETITTLQLMETS